MNRSSLLLTALIVCIGTSSLAEQYQNIKPGLRCHFARKDRSFCKVFPNFSLRHGICSPQPEVLGNIEWCREDITVTERLECGEYETYEAVVITYRPVYENGAWGKKFKRTFRKEPTLITPPVLVQSSK
ncbi:MAG: hypothetical protein GXX91_06625 [Verrucomicrobiaceae bacterium]|nr:hypothetical protein [Verrucomicrobiaceae bacterium]